MVPRIPWRKTATPKFASQTQKVRRVGAHSMKQTAMQTGPQTELPKEPQRCSMEDSRQDWTQKDWRTLGL